MKGNIRPITHHQEDTRMNSKPSTNQSKKCRLCSEKAIRLFGLCMKHSLEWADKRADESHFLEYGNLPPKTKAIKTPHGLTHGVGVDKKIIAPKTQEGKERKPFKALISKKIHRAFRKIVENKMIAEVETKERLALEQLSERLKNEGVTMWEGNNYILKIK